MKKICVITGTRAEYGLLKKTMTKIKNSMEFQLQVIAAAMHLSPEFGETYHEIEEDGFKIDWKVEMLLSSDTRTATSKSVGLGIIEFSTAYTHLKPDLILVLGDRYEILSAATAALIHNIPIAHYHGGELTEGAMDDAIRHSITKMSHIHLCSTDCYRQRVIQLGESPDRVYYVGAPGIENIVNLELMRKEELEKSLNFNLGDNFFLVTYHPTTLSSTAPEILLNELFCSLDEFPTHKVLITLPNSDPSGRRFIALFKAYETKNPYRVKVISSLGSLKYLSAASYSACVIGNSSSGLIEVPYLHTPTVNIGTRQLGRIGSRSVINCGESCPEIKRSIEIALSLDFKRQCSQSAEQNYGDGNVSDKVMDILRAIKFDELKLKKFYDLNPQSRANLI